MRESLRRSIPNFVLLFVSIAIPLIALVHLQVQSTLKGARDGAARRAMAAAELGATGVDEYLRGIAAYVEAYSRNPALLQGALRRDEAGVRAVLAELRLNNPRVDRVFVTDPSGVEWSDFPPDPSVIGKSFAHRDWYRGVSESERTYVSATYRRAAGNQERTVAIATTIRGASGEIRGYLVVQVLVASLEKQLAQTPVGGFSEILVLDRDDAIVTGADSTAATRIRASLPEIVRQCKSGTPIHWSELGGEPHILAYAPAPALGGCILAIRSVDAAIGAARAISRAVYSLAVAIALLLAWMVNAMLARRGRRIEGLRAAERTLEAQVAERTESLTASVARLRLEIGERRKAEASLRESQQRFRATFEQAAVGIAHFSPHGKLLRVNQKLCEIVDYTRDELLQEKLRSIVRIDEPGIDDCTDDEALKRLGEWKNGICTAEREILRKDGTPVWCHLTIAPVPASGSSPEYFIAVIEDISDRKRLEEQFLQSQKMRAIGQLAGGVAHDFNNLLTTILGYCELLQRRFATEEPARGYVDEICKAGERASALTAQLLAFSRKQILKPIPLDLNEVVGAMDRLLRRLIGEDIELATKLDPNLGPVKADPGQIEQVLMNLVVNARDAMPDGGRITIETVDRELDEAAVAEHPGLSPGAYAMISVTDTGVGMDAATQAQLFEPFFTTKEKGKGTGLGLSTVYGIVKQSGGAITVWSEPGAGSVFRVYLPRTKSKPVSVSAHPVALGPVEGSEGETVLLVEDDDVLRGLTRRVLEENGYRVVGCGGRRGGDRPL